jgi:predicted DNA-binding transcriptional regulator AlpA
MRTVSTEAIPADQAWQTGANDHPPAMLANMTRQLLSTPAAARAVGISIATMFRWMSAGKIRPDSTTVGGHHRWDVDQLRAQIAAAARRPRSPDAAEDQAPSWTKADLRALGHRHGVRLPSTARRGELITELRAAGVQIPATPPPPRRP